MRGVRSHRVQTGSWRLILLGVGLASALGRALDLTQPGDGKSTCSVDVSADPCRWGPEFLGRIVSRLGLPDAPDAHVLRERNHQRFISSETEAEGGRRPPAVGARLRPEFGTGRLSARSSAPDVQVPRSA